MPLIHVVVCCRCLYNVSLIRRQVCQRHYTAVRRLQCTDILLLSWCSNVRVTQHYRTICRVVYVTVQFCSVQYGHLSSPILIAKSHHERRFERVMVSWRRRLYWIVFARDSICCKRAYAIAIPSVCLSVTRVDQSKTVEVRIMQFSPYGSPIPLVFAH